MAPALTLAPASGDTGASWTRSAVHTRSSGRLVSTATRLSAARRTGALRTLVEQRVVGVTFRTRPPPHGNGNPNQSLGAKVRLRRRRRRRCVAIRSAPVAPLGRDDDASRRRRSVRSPARVRRIISQPVHDGLNADRSIWRGRRHGFVVVHHSVRTSVRTIALHWRWSTRSPSRRPSWAWQWWATTLTELDAVAWHRSPTSRLDITHSPLTSSQSTGWSAVVTTASTPSRSTTPPATCSEV